MPLAEPIEDEEMVGTARDFKIFPEDIEAHNKENGYSEITGPKDITLDDIKWKGKNDNSPIIPDERM